MPTKLLEKDGFTFVLEEVGGITRVKLAAGRMVAKKTKVNKAKIPEPISGSIGKGTSLYDLGVDRGHIVAQHVGGPNIAENIVPMYSFFNRIGPWRAAELDMLANLDSSPYVSIQISYDPQHPALPTAFRYDTSSSPLAAVPNGKEVRMQLMPTRPYNPYTDETAKADTNEAIASFNNLVAPKVPKFMERPRDNPYLILDEINEANGNLFRIEPFRPFSKGQRVWIKMLNSHYHEKGLLTSDEPTDAHKELNCFGGLNYPQVDHDAPASYGGTNNFTNARLVSFQHNNHKRDQTTLDQFAAFQLQAQDVRENRNLRSRGGHNDHGDPLNLQAWAKKDTARQKRADKAVQNSKTARGNQFDALRKAGT